MASSAINMIADERFLRNEIADYERFLRKLRVFEPWK